MRLAASTALVLSLAVAACSSSSSGGGGSSSTPCNENPWECPSGQTCWPQSQTAFACLNAGSGAVGSACQDTAGAPTCGAGLFCLQSAGATAGTCVAYCSNMDTQHACTGGAACEPAALGGVSGPAFFVCVPMATGGGDGGTKPDGGGTADGGSDAPAGG
ncbi:MAG TPA: hypothetical protein VMI75_05050 [Polyangiaceae bacterium]|nr:hypothetical protein [Polyangiaceae bacterium]